jgi:hypothetical protein
VNFTNGQAAFTRVILKAVRVAADREAAAFGGWEPNYVHAQNKRDDLYYVLGWWPSPSTARDVEVAS